MMKKNLRVFGSYVALPLLLVLSFAAVSLATPSAVNGRIAFASSRSGNTDIYTMVARYGSNSVDD